MVYETFLETDVLVIGGGLSGLFAAIKAREAGADVIIAEKGYTGKSGAALYAKSTTIFNKEWGHDLKQWMNQVAKSGDYMNNPEWTEITFKEAADRYRDLLSWGVEFPTGKNGEPIFLPSNGIFDESRLEWRFVLPILRQQAEKSEVRIMDRIMITDLLKQEGMVTGAVGFHTGSGDFYVFKAKATVMCTGTGILGIGNSLLGQICSASTYEGEAMAYRAGANLSGKEFSISGVGSFSYVGDGLYGDRTQGDTRISLEGKKIGHVPPGWLPSMYINKYVDSEGNKVNRQTMAVAIHQGRGPFYWNLDDATPEEIGMSVAGDMDSGIKVAQGGFYQAPMEFEYYAGWAVHNASGIASADTGGGTSLPGLYAAGDAYNSKAIGAKYTYRGFATRNAMVVGTRAGRSAAEFALQEGGTALNQAEITRLKNKTYAPLERKGGFDQPWVSLQVKTILYPYYVLFIKKEDRLKAALTMIEFVKKHLTPMIYASPRDAHGLRLAHETKGRVLASEMMLRAALFRTESRGVHYREDYPFRDDPNWLADVEIKNKDGRMDLIRKPLPQQWWPDLSIPYKDRYDYEYLGEEFFRQNK